MNKKYELTTESVMVGETKLYRIKALKDISYRVKAGERVSFTDLKNSEVIELH